MNFSNFTPKNGTVKSFSQRDDNPERLKYYTTNHIDLLSAKDKMNEFSIDYRDTLFAPSAKNIDIDSRLTQSKLTNCRMKYGFGQLPFPTMPQRHQLSHNNEKLDTEDKMRFLDYQNSIKKKTCIPRDSDFYKRYFYIFEGNGQIELPDPLKSVERPENMWGELRCGRPSRFDRRPQ